MENFQEVMTANRALLARARDLNTRAGQSVFSVPNRDELTKLFVVALGGARGIAEIHNISALHLPSLDDRMIERVLSENPDTIIVLGRQIAVEYRSGYNPRVRLDFRGEESRNWLQLPDTGIQLPGGREVAMYSAVEGYSYYIEAASSQFKVKARECLNQGLWDNWRKPELPVPTDSIPPIMEMEYGRCVVTEVSLVAYGTVNYDSWYGSWKSYWSRSRAETEQVYAQACAKFLEVKEKAVRDALKKRVGELYSAHSYNREMPEEMRTRLYNTYYGYSGGATTAAEMEAFIAEVEAAVATISEQKAEAERKQREAETRREQVNTALSNMGYGEAHIWVPVDGKVAYILAGKTSKMGGFEITPDAGDTTYDGPYCFGDSKYRRWVPFKFGVRSQARDYSSRGNLQSEVTLFVPSGLLATGVYGVGSDDEGQYFFPVIYNNAEDAEVIPEVSAIRKIRVPKEPKASAKSGTVPPNSDDTVDLSKVDLSKLFGGGATIRRR